MLGIKEALLYAFYKRTPTAWITYTKTWSYIIDKSGFSEFLWINFPSIIYI